MCLSSKNATAPPSTVRERTYLANSGLGDASLTFSPGDMVYEGLLSHYLPLKEGGGFELFLFQRGGGEDGGFHKIYPPHTASHLKELAGQAKIYIKPLQRDLKKTAELVALPQVFDTLKFFMNYTYLKNKQSYSTVNPIENKINIIIIQNKKGLFLFWITKLYSTV